MNEKIYFKWNIFKPSINGEMIQLMINFSILKGKLNIIFMINKVFFAYQKYWQCHMYLRTIVFVFQAKFYGCNSQHLYLAFHNQSQCNARNTAEIRKTVLFTTFEQGITAAHVE